VSAGGQGQGGQHTEEVRASGQAMEHANAKGRVAMNVRVGLLVRMEVAVHVDMDVALTIVSVFVRVNMVSQCPTKSPQANSNQQYANEPVAPRRNQVNRQHLAEQEGAGADHSHAQRVPQSPAQPGVAGPAAPFHRQGRHGSEMVWARKDMNETGQKSWQNQKHKRRKSRLSSGLSTPE
jgi:hypothetical protein